METQNERRTVTHRAIEECVSSAQKTNSTAPAAHKIK